MGDFKAQGKRKKSFTKKEKAPKRSKKPVASKKKIESLIKKNEKTELINSKKAVKEIKKTIKFGNTNDSDITDADIIKALMQKGTLAGASKLLGCTYSGLVTRVKSNPNITEILEMKNKEIVGVLQDFAIDNILTLLLAGDFNASKFVLEKRCGWNGDFSGNENPNVLSDQDIKNKIENMTQEEREERILQLQEKLMNKKIIDVVPIKGGENEKK